jgi:hypothetical protein
MFYIPPSDLPADPYEHHQPADGVVSEKYRMVFDEETSSEPVPTEEVVNTDEPAPAEVVEVPAEEPVPAEVVEAPVEETAPAEVVEVPAEEAAPAEVVEAPVEETAPAEVVEAEAEMGDTGVADTAAEETTVVEETPAPAEGIGTSPSDEDITTAASKIKEIFSDGFQWSDLATMVRESYAFMKDFPDVTGAERRDAVNRVIFKIIDLTDTPYLPDRFTDPLFKALVPPFTDLIGSAVEGWVDDNNVFDTRPGMDGMPTKEAILDVAQEIRSTFADGFQWSDLGTAVRISVQFARALKDVDDMQRKETVVQVVNALIDITDTPYMPDYFVDPVFKAVVPPVVDDIMKALGS